MLWLLCILAEPNAALAQTASANDTPIQVEGVEVVARRGAAAMPAEREYGAGEIDALHADNISQVVERLNRQMGATSPPVVIVNGQRVPDAEAYLGFPPDALTRIEALPPSASALYGGSPDRRVINVVLQKSFRGKDGVVSADAATAGGAERGSGTLALSSINGMDTRRGSLNLAGETALRAKDRPDYLAAHPENEDTTLRPESRRLSGNLSSTGALGAWRGSINLAARTQESRFVSTAGGQAIANRYQNSSLALTGGLGRQFGDLSVNGSLGAQLSHGKSSGLTNTQSDRSGLNLNLSANRKLFTLPAGAITADLSASASRSRSSTESSGVSRNFSSASEDANLMIYAPLWDATSASTPRSKGWPGRATLSLGAGARRADGAQAANVNSSLQWSPVSGLNLNGSWTRDTAVPTDEQRFAPAIYGAPSLVYDFRTGQAVEVVTLSGGNPDLRSTTTDAYQFSASTPPVTSWRLQGEISYRGTRTANGMGSLPPLTLDIEAAFPDRFQRDAEGRLVSIDQRPINIASADSSTLGASLSFSLPNPNGGGLGGGDSLQVWMSHNVRLEDTITIHDGLPVMDRLAGDAGGASRHQFTMMLDGRRGAWGLNATANWQGPYRVRGQSGLDAAGDLKVDDMGTISIRLSRDYQAPIAKAREGAPTRRNAGLTVSLGIDNLLDARARAKLGDGRPAPGYGRDDRDAIGRVARLTLNGRF
jgi:hypothetical protein